MRVSKLKLLREKYRITTRSLGKACGISAQRICEIEAKGAPVTPETEEKLCRGLELVIQARKTDLDGLRADLEKHRGTLSDYVEESTYEL